MNKLTQILETQKSLKKVKEALSNASQLITEGKHDTDNLEIDQLLKELRKLRTEAGQAVQNGQRIKFY